MKPWILYVLRCVDDSLYTGITNDLDRRLQRHNLGKGAKYTRSRRPVEVLVSTIVGTKASALRLEYRFKKLNRQKKLMHVQDHLRDFLKEHATTMNE